MRYHFLRCLPWIAAGSFAIASAIARPARANMLTLPPSFAHDLLTETVPTAFAPNDFTSSDFTVEWSGAPIPGVEARIGENTLQWARVSEVIVLPRARLLLAAKDAEGGRVSHAGFSQAFVRDDADAGAASILRSEIVVALISGDRNPIELSVMRGGKELRGALRIRFRPRGAGGAYFDTSCSRLGVDARSVSQKADGEWKNEWMYVGCRQQVARGERHSTAALELYVFWDNVGQTIEVGGVPTAAASVSVWPLRLRSAPGTARLKAGAHEIELSYRIPEHLNMGYLGMGLGPYTYAFAGPTDDLTSVAPILTLYGSYFISETIRIVAFDATSVSRLGFTDLGLYLSTENFRVVDRRLSINLLLGGHVVAFEAAGKLRFKPGGPQGLEMIWYDAFSRGNNLSAGAFIYPSIGGKSYHNIWLRWGSSVFAEFNFISWEEQLEELSGSQRVFSKSVGLTVGFPLARFL